MFPEVFLSQILITRGNRRGHLFMRQITESALRRGLREHEIVCEQVQQLLCEFGKNFGNRTYTSEPACRLHVKERQHLLLSNFKALSVGLSEN